MSGRARSATTSGVVAVRGVDGDRGLGTGRRPRSRPTPPPPARCGSRTSGRSPTTTRSRRCRTRSAPPPRTRRRCAPRASQQLAERLASPDSRGRGRGATCSRSSRTPGSSATTRWDDSTHRRVPRARCGRRARGRQRRIGRTRARRRAGGEGAARGRGAAGRRQRVGEVTDGPDRADAVQPIRDNELATIGVDGRRPRPAPRARPRSCSRSSDLFVSAATGGRPLRLRADATPLPGSGHRREPRVGARGRGRRARGRRSSPSSRRRLSRHRTRRDRGAATPAPGPGARSSRCPTPSGPTSSRRRPRTSTGCSRQSAVGAMVTNGVDRPTPLAERLRDRGRRRARAVGNGSTGNQGFGVDEDFGRDPAGVVFTTRTGLPAGDGLVYMPITDTIEANDERALRRRARSARRRARHGRASRAPSIANGDGTDPSTPEHRGRRRGGARAVAALDDERGQGPRRPGRRRRCCARTPPRRSACASIPTGWRAPSRTRGSPARWCWSRAPTSCGPTSRSQFASDEQAVKMRARRARATPTASSAGCSSTSTAARHGHGRGADAAAGARRRSASPSVRAPGFEPGLLRSTTTQHDGFVNLVDVAPTVLTYFGLDRPDVDGRPADGDRRRGRARSPTAPSSSSTPTRTACSATAWSGRR